MASKRIGTRENLASPLHSGIPYPENILREARQNLGFASSCDRQILQIQKHPVS